MKKSVLGLALLLGAMAAMVVGVGAAQAAPTTRYVANGGNDTANDCSTQATPCATIQHAVTEAVAGDIISVGPGTYTESVTVNKSLTLLGAQAGVDARNRNADGTADSGETIATSASGPTFRLTTGTTTVDGFKFENTGGSAGIFLEGGVNHTVRNDIFSGINPGYAANGIFNGATFRHNRIEGTEWGFESDLAPGPDTTIDANKFVGTSEYDVNFIEGGTGDVISRNEREGGGGNFAVLFKTNGATVTGNLVTGISSSVVYVGGGTENTSISGNTFTANSSGGVSVADEFGDGPNRSLSITENTLTQMKRGVRVGSSATTGVVEIHSNRISGNSEAGVLNLGTGAIDASANWWGCNAGPNASGCDKATGPIDSGDWLVLALSASPSQIYAGSGSSQMTATLTRDSAGDAVGSVPASTPIAFATSLGGISAATTTTEAGRAQAELQAPSGVGTAEVTATLDNQIVGIPVQILVPPTGPTGATGPAGATGSQGASGVQGAAGSNGSSGSSVALKRKMSLRFLGSKATLTGDDVAVKVRCLGSTAKQCVGTLTLQVGGQTVKAAYSVAAGKTGTVKVALGEGASTRGAGGTVPATAKTLQPSGGATTTKHTLHLS